MSVGGIAAWLAGLAVMACAAPALAQGNLDAGKSASQIFGETCAVCHKSARELKRSSASFLREHYTTGSAEAAAMANYLSGVGSDPRAVAKRAPPGTGPTEARQTPAGEAAPAAGRRSGDQGKPVPVLALNHRPSTGTEESKPATPAVSPLVRLDPAVTAAPVSAQAGAARLPEFEE